MRYKIYLQIIFKVRLLKHLMDKISSSWHFGPQPAEIVILAGIHGNEKANVETITQFMKSNLLTDLKKGVLFIIGNSKALEKNVRYTETDLNREFGVFSNSTEGKRAKEISNFLEKANFLLDLHLTQTPTLEPFSSSVPTKNNISFLEKMDVPINNFVLSSAVNPGSMSTDEYLIYKNPEGIALTLELGSILDNPNKIIELGKRTITEFLKVAGAIKNNKEIEKRNIDFWKNSQFIENKENTDLIPGIKNFMPIKKGQVIAYETNNSIKALFDGKALFPKYVKTTDKYLLRVITKQQDI